jgi:glycosyltransferase involved in cell wall biosynthesis
MNPRVMKEAAALASDGYEVQVLGASFSKDDLITSRELASERAFAFVPVASVGNDNLKARSQWLFYRARRKYRRWLQRRLKQEPSWDLGPLLPELLSSARLAKADYYIVHLEQAMFVGGILIRNGFKVGVDMEDWYSEDLLPEVRLRRPVGYLRSLEQELLLKCAHATCPSEAMSTAMMKEFGCSPPAVIYNAFPWSDRKKLDGEIKNRKNGKIPSIHWYSQTLGHGRGLEDLFAALPYLSCDAEIHLRGEPAGGFDEWLAKKVPSEWRSRVFVHGLVSNAELLSRIAEHDIGLAPEMRYSRSRDLTVTNKVLHYLLGGLAVVASDTAGQREVAEKAQGAVQIYPSGNGPALAAELNLLFSLPEKLQAAKDAALHAAQTVFSWEHQAPRLIQSVDKALASAGG